MINNIPFSILEPDELALLSGRVRVIGEKIVIRDTIYTRLPENLKGMR